MELSFSEMVVIALIAFVVLGPKEMVKQATRLGKFLNQMRREFENFKHLTREEILKEEAFKSIDHKGGLTKLKKLLDEEVTVENERTRAPLEGSVEERSPAAGLPAAGEGPRVIARGTPRLTQDTGGHGEHAFREMSLGESETAAKESGGSGAGDEH